MSYQERVASPCIGAGRRSGAGRLRYFRCNSPRLPCPACAFADRGLREGILVEMMRADGVWGGGSQAALS